MYVTQDIEHVYPALCQDCFHEPCVCLTHNDGCDWDYYEDDDDCEPDDDDDDDDDDDCEPDDDCDCDDDE